MLSRGVASVGLGGGGRLAYTERSDRCGVRGMDHGFLDELSMATMASITAHGRTEGGGEGRGTCSMPLAFSTDRFGCGMHQMAVLGVRSSCVLRTVPCFPIVQHMGIRT